MIQEITNIDELSNGIIYTDGVIVVHMGARQNTPDPKDTRHFLPG